MRGIQSQYVLNMARKVPTYVIMEHIISERNAGVDLLSGNFAFGISSLVLLVAKVSQDRSELCATGMLTDKEKSKFNMFLEKYDKLNIVPVIE